VDISLSPELERLIAEKIRSGRYRSANEVIREGLELLQAQEATTHPESAKDLQPISDVFAGIANDVPDSEWAKVPTDLSKNIDGYVYGTKS
jgi:putative addiction module CopG family antidote